MKNEPTIDEMLEWYDEAIDTQRSGKPMYLAIRAILEQHRNRKPMNEPQLWSVQELRELADIELRAIRAFVERVEKRVTTHGVNTHRAIRDELAAMSAEAGGDDERGG
jgi:hypothetical protein